MPTKHLRKPVTGYALAITLLVCVALSGAVMAIVLQVNRNTELKFCDIVISQDDTYKQTPPSTATGRAAAANWTQLRRNLNCQEKR